MLLKLSYVRVVGGTVSFCWNWNLYLVHFMFLLVLIRISSKLKIFVRRILEVHVNIENQ